MHKTIFTPHGQGIVSPKTAARTASLQGKAAQKNAASRKTVSWDSAFHAERGCLHCSPHPGAGQPHSRVA